MKILLRVKPILFILILTACHKNAATIRPGTGDSFKAKRITCVSICSNGIRPTGAVGDKVLSELKTDRFFAG